MRRTSDSSADGSDLPSRSLRWLIVALVVIVVAQVARVLFPIMFEIGEDWDFLLAGLVALVTFSTPVVALLARHLRPDHAMVGGAATVGFALIGLRLAEPIPAWFAIVAVAAALIGATVLVARTSLGSLGRVGPLVPAIVVGLAADSALRAVFESWDLVWQQDAASLVIAIVLAGALLTAALVAAGAESGNVVPVSATLWLRLGAYVMLQLLFLQNLGFVGSQAGIGYVAAVVTVLSANLVALAALRVVPPLNPGVTIGFAALAVFGGWLITLITGVVVVAVVIAVHAALTAFIADAATRTPHREPAVRTTVLAIAAGSVLFLTLVLVWSIDIDQPLPFPRQMLPAAAVLVVVSAVVPAGLIVKSVARPSGSAVAIAGVLMVAAPFALVMTEPDTGPVSSDAEIRLVDYNVRGSVDTDGQLAPDRIVSAIQSSDPDVVVLQEVARGWAIHGTMDLLAYLERNLGMESTFVAAADGQFGNAILSRLPMAELDSGQLPEDGVQARAYALVVVEVPGGELSVAVAHIHTRSTVQVTALLDAVDGSAPLVIAGDMNIAPDDPEVALFTDAGLVDTVDLTGDPCRTTSAEPTSSCDRPDWVFVTPDVTVAELHIGTGGASDHLPIHVALGS